MRILLVEPSDKAIAGLNFSGLFTMEPMSLELIAAAVPEHEVKIVDLRLDPLPLAHYILEFKPDVVGITGITALHSEMEDVLAQAKRFGCFAVAGGPHASFAYEALSNLDVAVIGEGEGTFNTLISTLACDGELSSVPNIAWRDADGWHLTNRKFYEFWPLPRRCFARDYKYKAFGLEVAMVEATRGCPHRCSFCVTPQLFEGRYRVRPVEEIVDYMLTRPEPFIMFPDPDFMASRKYVQSLLDGVREASLEKKYGVAVRSDEVVSHQRLIREWSEAGLCFAFIGFEGYEQSQQDNYQKDSRLEYNEEAVSILDDYNIITIGTLIVDPKWLSKQLNDCLIYAKRLGSDITLFSILTPFPGTPIEEERPVIATYNKYDVLHAVTKTILPYQEFQRAFAKISKRVFLSKATLKLFRKLFRRRLLSITGMGLLGKLLVYIATIERKVTT